MNDFELDEERKEVELSSGLKIDLNNKYMLIVALEVYLKEVSHAVISAYNRKSSPTSEDNKRATEAFELLEANIPNYKKILQ